MKHDATVTVLLRDVEVGALTDALLAIEAFDQRLGEVSHQRLGAIVLPMRTARDAVLAGRQEVPNWVVHASNTAIASQVRDILTEIKTQAVRDDGRLTPQSILSIQTAINLLEGTHNPTEEPR